MQRREPDDAHSEGDYLRDWVDALGVRYEPEAEGQLKVLALDPEAVWLTHVAEPWRPDASRERKR